MKTTNQISFCRDPLVKGIEVCSIIKSCHVFPDHSHDDLYAFGLMKEGGNYLNRREEDNSLVKPGDIALIPPGLVHSGVPVKNTPATYQMIYMNLALMEEVSNDILENDYLSPEFENVIIYDPQISLLFRQLCSIIDSDSELLEKDSCLTTFLGQMILEHGMFKNKITAPGVEHKSIHFAMEYLSENLDRKISLEDVATAAGFIF